MKVRIAEEDAVSRRLLEATLDRWGYEVVTAADGAEAWRVLGGADAPLLALLDWMMPGLDGIEVCRRVRERTTPTPMYLIRLTAKGQRDDVVGGLAAGADHHVTKPFDRAELCARVAVGARIVELQQALADRVRALEEALAQVKHLRGLLPICAYCKKIRADQDYWQQVETYVAAHSEAQFSHSICPTCYEAVVKPQLDEFRRAQGAVTADPPAAS